MRYMVLIYEIEQKWASMTPEAASAEMGEYMAYTQAMAEAGVMRAGDPLKPTFTATTVRVREGKRHTTDGPFAETKEQLGGYYILECGSLDEALRWAAKCPGALTGSVEVRPIADLSAASNPAAHSMDAVAAG